MLPQRLAADAEAAGPQGIDDGEEERQSLAHEAPQEEVEKAG
jgi:hypothetical protein